MNIKISTIADRIQNGFINKNELKNIKEFAKKENMLLHSIPLKDGTTAKILANAIEYDCLIMKNGKVLTAKGQAGTAEKVAEGVMGIFEHILRRRRAVKNINIENEKFNFIDKYLTNYEKYMTEI